MGYFLFVTTDQVLNGITLTECPEASPSWAAQAESLCSHCASWKVSGVRLSP